MPAPDVKNCQRYTYADYLTWPDDERWELIDGVPYMMSPAPGNNHQDAQDELLVRLDTFLKGKPCSVRSAPQDVRFEQENQTRTVVQPDLTVWCRKNPDSRAGELKAVVEILSPSTADYDLAEKLSLYERHEIPEYWVVSLEKPRFLKYVLINGKYHMTAYPTGAFTTALFPEFMFDIEEFFRAVDERGIGPEL